MSKKIGSGAITLTDIMDGIQPVVFQLSNEAHAFVANPAGDVGDDLNSFDCFTDVWVGEDKASYLDRGVVAITESNKANYKNKYNVTVTSNNSSWVPKLVSSGDRAKITLDAVPTGTVDKSASLKVLFTCVNTIGNIVESERSITLTKGIQGVDGVAVRLEADSNYFMADADNNITTPEMITIKTKVIGDCGTLKAWVKKDGGVETPVDTFVQKDADADGYNDTNIIISKEYFGLCDRLSVIVRGSAASTASDVLTIARVKEGQRGKAALSVFISSDKNGMIFKNGSSDTHRKTLSAKVYDMETGTEISDGITFLWKGDNEIVKVDAGDNVVPEGSSGAVNATNSFIIVGSEDVPDGESVEYSCECTVSEDNL